VADLLSVAEPIGPVYGTRSTANRRRFFEKMRRWPAGFVVVGDAVATYNPAYGQGLSVLARNAAALHAALADTDLSPEHAGAIQGRIAEAVDGAWAAAIAQDVFYPHVVGGRPTLSLRIFRRYLYRLTSTANSDPAVAQAILDTFSLSEPMTRLLNPRIVLAGIRGPATAERWADPVLTDNELAALTSSKP
jgi:hypothetical protein